MLSVISKAEFLALLVMTVSGAFFVVALVFLIEDNIYCSEVMKYFQEEHEGNKKVAIISFVIMCISSIVFLIL